ncbi:MAG TPA: restriction endonuclease [bacterium]|nr:restriction endonuclease [bacterium]
MEILDAAHEVLSQARVELHYREIAKRIVSQKLFLPTAKDFGHVVGSRLCADTKSNGSASRFRHGSRGGLFRLASEQPADREAVTTVPRGPMKILGAVEHVLRSVGHPMTAKELAAEITSQKLFSSRSGKFENMVLGRVYQDTRDRVARGEKPRFVRLAGGAVGLVGMSTPSPASQAGAPATPMAPAGLRSLSPTQLEQLVGDLLSAVGYDRVVVTPATHDRGVDVEGHRPLDSGGTVAVKVQVKHWKAKVQAPDIQKIRGAAGPAECMVVTSGEFSAGAIKEANRPEMKMVRLIDGRHLESLLLQYGVPIAK